MKIVRIKDREIEGIELRDHWGIIFASLYTIIKKQNGQYLFIGAKSMPYHRSKKVLFLPYLSFETKKSFLVGGWWWWWVVGGGWKVTLVSVCVHFLKLLDTQTHRHRNGHRAWQYLLLSSYYSKVSFSLMTSSNYKLLRTTFTILFKEVTGLQFQETLWKDFQFQAIIECFLNDYDCMIIY